METTVTLSQARALIQSLASDQSILLLSPPGVGKSEVISQAAQDSGLPLRSLLGTQIAPEDVSGIPRIVGERSVFCPPRVLLPENPEPFCLFLDELPATSPDVQKAFYSLLLERRLGEHSLPRGTWVVAAGNRTEDRALVRSMSSALVNRVCILNVRVDTKEWLFWAQENEIRPEIIAFILFMPEALARPVPSAPVPFSTPRSWTLLSRALDRVESEGLLRPEILAALAFGRVTASDAAVFCAMIDQSITDLRPVVDYLKAPSILPQQDTARWFILNRIRILVATDQFPDLPPQTVHKFLMAVPEEHRFSLFVGLVEKWGKLGADQAMLASLREAVGLH